MVGTETGEFTEKTLGHEGNAVRAFYAALEGPVLVGIEATGAMQCFSATRNALPAMPTRSKARNAPRSVRAAEKGWAHPPCIESPLNLPHSPALEEQCYAKCDSR
jgi:hypothetical protein